MRVKFCCSNISQKRRTSFSFFKMFAIGKECCAKSNFGKRWNLYNFNSSIEYIVYIISKRKRRSFKLTYLHWFLFSSAKPVIYTNSWTNDHRYYDYRIICGYQVSHVPLLNDIVRLNSTGTLVLGRDRARSRQFIYLMYRLVDKRCLFNHCWLQHI